MLLTAAKLAGRSAVHSVVTAALCLQLVLPAAAQQEMSAAPPQDKAQSQPIPLHQAAPLPRQELTIAPDAAAPKDSLLTPDARILLVLDRFTYGPRPGELDRVRQMGLTAWFRQQLNPVSIDDSALDERLRQYPAMSLPIDKLFAAFPPNDAVLAGMNGRGPSAVGDPMGRLVLKHREEYFRDNKLGARKGAAAAAGVLPAAPVVALPDTPEHILALPPEDRFKFLCKLSNPELRQLNLQLAPADRESLTQGFTPAQLETLQAFNGPTEVLAREDVEAKLLRDIYSERQLLEVMTDFWLNHFNVYLRKNQQAAYFIAQYTRDIIRPHALGHFQDLLLASAQSPAMLQYLDQSESIGPHSDAAGNGGGFRPKAAGGLNENYAREVMELHTVGVDAGYTQRDVTELAKVFTGWGVQEGYRNGEPTRPTFDLRRHEPGAKTVLGKKIRYRGMQEGFDVLEMLAATPQCAHFISQKLAVHFVGDDPPKPVVDRMTATFLATQGDIRRVLAAMVNSPEFFTAATFRAKVKTPQEFVVSAVRATGAEVTNPQALARTIADLGMPLFGRQTPDGYSMRSDAWNSTTALVSRMNFSMALATNRVQGVSVDVTRILGSNPSGMTPQQKQAAVEAFLLHTRVSPKTEQLIAQETTAPEQQQRTQLAQVNPIYGGGRFFAAAKSTPGRAPLRGRPGSNLGDLDLPAALATGLVLGSPEFQRR